jgi:antitoxin ParD1/3/4
MSFQTQARDALIVTCGLQPSRSYTGLRVRGKSRYMPISLTPDQQAWINAHIASGDFDSVEEAVRLLLDERIAERAAEEEDDLAWAKPYVDEALVDVAHGKVLTLQEHRARNAARLAALKG